MPGHDIIVIGCSAGGMEALKQVVGGLPKDFPAVVFIVWHMSPHMGSLFVLPETLKRSGKLTAAAAEDGKAMQRGRVYVAPPDHHLMLERDHMRLTRGPKENRFRPAIDPLFRSAAYHFGPRVIGVILTGMLDDGTAGLWAVKDRGGITVVQDPLDAEYPSMPRSAQQYVETDHCVPAKDIAPLLIRLAQTPADGAPIAPLSKGLDVETKIALGQNAERMGVMELGELSPFTCPECHGTLIQMHSGGIPRFRCHTGHAYSVQSLLGDLSESMENTLWSAVRSLEEAALLTRQMSDHLRSLGQTEAADAYAGKAADALRRAERIRQTAMHQGSVAAEAGDAR